MPLFFGPNFLMPDYYSLGLVGYPLEHSLSPRLHMAALQDLHLAGEYLLYPIEHPSDLQDILGEMRSGKIHGLNVTIPYKEVILSLLDDLSPAAQAIGAVNTVSQQDGNLLGDNTDARGFYADMERLGWSKIDKPDRYALVLGAGGSARAIVYALANAGWRITISARRQEQAATLVKLIQRSTELTSNYGELSKITLDKESIANLNPRPSLIINTTQVGMYPQVDASPWPEGLDFSPQAAVYDLIYNPAETALMRAAQRMGLQVANGIGMLVEQAALSLEIWTGLATPRQVMHHAVTEYSASIR
jgi:shikimate dehydrogenase